MKGQQHTKPVVWTFGQLRDALIGKAVDVQGSKYLVEVPRFQRGFVWKQAKQRRLIESVRDGYPIGALVMCRIGTKDIGGETVTVFHLIDGLQRSVTIKHYLEAPLKWFHDIAEEVAPEASLAELLKALDSGASTLSVVELRNEISNWMEAIGSLDHRKLTQFSLWNHINTTLLSGGSDKFSPRAAEILQDIIVDAQNETAFEHHEIPVLLYSGDRLHTPKIFDLLNQQGQKLSTYQKLAAIWVVDEVDPHSIDPRVVMYIKRRQTALAKDGYVLEGAVSISLFDYLNGYGHLLAAEHPGLFSARKDGEESPHGFYLAALCTHVRLTTEELKDLPKDFASGEQLDLRSLEGIVEKGIAIVSDAIEPWLQFSIRSKKTKSGTADRPILTDLQVASLVAWASLRVSSGAPMNRELLVRALRRRIVKEVLEETWKGGPVDSLAFTRVWAHNSTPTRRVLNDVFERPISDSEFEDLLEKWFKGQIEDRIGLRSGITDRQRLVLKLIAASSAKYFQQFAIFDIDHLIPVSILRDAQKQETWPINCIANLGLLPESLNKEKGDKTFHQWYVQPCKIEEPLQIYQDNRQRAKATAAIEDPLLWDLSGFSGSKPFRFNDYERILREHWAHQKRLIIDSVK